MMKKTVLTLAAAALLSLGGLSAAADTTALCPNPNCPYDGSCPYVQEGTCPACPNGGQRPQDGTGRRLGAGRGRGQGAGAGMGRGQGCGQGVCRRG